MVIYDGAERAPSQICNEKALCGLGRELRFGGALDPDAVAMALATLARFRHILDEHGDPHTRVIATAAVREASDGAAFVDAVRDVGFEVEIIDGLREAKLASMGVLSYIPDADGIVGDMGGGSLELVDIADQKIDNAISLSIGPLRLMQQTGGDIERAQDLIDPLLDKAAWLGRRQAQILYAVGGAWRAVARIHMRLRSYPLPVLHHYELSKRDAIDLCELISRQSRKSLEEIPGIPRRRIDTLPYAALVLRSVLERCDAEHMIVSAGGLREGLLYEDLSEEARSLDPLIAGATFFARRLSPDFEFAAAAASLTSELFSAETSAETRLREATCMLIDAAAFFHPDLRGDQAFDTALRAPFYGMTHKERLAMALALFVRHEGRRAVFPDERAIGLLSWEEQQRAVRLGLAMRFAAAIAPKAPSILAGARVFMRDGVLVFRAARAIDALLTEFPLRRLESLAASFEAEAVCEFMD